MTQATDRDIAEIKDLITADTRSIESLARITENIARVTESNAKAIEANTKAISDLVTSVSGLREEMRVGFSDMRGQINTVEAKLEGKIDKLDERTLNPIGDRT